MTADVIRRSDVSYVSCAPSGARYQSLIVALVLSRLNYCNSILFELPANLIRRLESDQNAAARLIVRLRRSSAFTGCVSHNVSPSNWQF